MGFSKSKVDNTRFWIGTVHRHQTHNVWATIHVRYRQTNRRTDRRQYHANSQSYCYHSSPFRLRACAAVDK